MTSVHSLVDPTRVQAPLPHYPHPKSHPYPPAVPPDFNNYNNFIRVSPSERDEDVDIDDEDDEDDLDDDEDEYEQDKDGSFSNKSIQLPPSSSSSSNKPLPSPQQAASGFSIHHIISPHNAPHQSPPKKRDPPQQLNSPSAANAPVRTGSTQELRVEPPSASQGIFPPSHYLFKTMYFFCTYLIANM